MEKTPWYCTGCGGRVMLRRPPPRCTTCGTARLYFLRAAPSLDTERAPSWITSLLEID